MTLFNNARLNQARFTKSEFTKFGAALLAALAVASAPLAGHAATLQPGTFFGLAAITSETGFLCSAVALPSSVQFSLAYPGPSQPGGDIELLVPGSSFKAYGVTLPTTPAAGITSWSGPVSVTVPGAGSLSGNVAIAGVASDASAFIGTIALDVGPGFCTINIGVEGSHSGRF